MLKGEGLSMGLDVACWFEIEVWAARRASLIKD